MPAGGLQFSETPYEREHANERRELLMNSLATDSTFNHEPVMATEITELFGAVPHGVVVDATLGGAGHAMRLLAAYPWMSVFGIDQDPMAIDHARKVSPQFDGRLMFHQGRFDGVTEFLQMHNVPKISGALFDLGVSSPQFDEANRGFSYRNDGQLDMRMDTTQEFSALDVVNGYEVQQLADVLRDHADERFAFRIAKAIVAARPVMTTSVLAEIVASAIPAPARRTGGHPAKRTFQAIRIEVNKELEILPKAISDAIAATEVGGRIAVLSYHSGEDRIVKQAFRDAETRPGVTTIASPFQHHLSSGKLVKKVRVAEHASAEEIERNPRASSARLRVIEKVGC